MRALLPTFALLLLCLSVTGLEGEGSRGGRPAQTLYECVHISTASDDTLGDGSLECPFATLGRGIEVAFEEQHSHAAVCLHPGWYLFNRTNIYLPDHVAALNLTWDPSPAGNCSTVAPTPAPTSPTTPPSIPLPTPPTLPPSTTQHMSTFQSQSHATRHLPSTTQHMSTFQSQSHATRHLPGPEHVRPVTLSASSHEWEAKQRHMAHQRQYAGQAVVTFADEMITFDSQGKVLQLAGLVIAGVLFLQGGTHLDARDCDFINVSSISTGAAENQAIRWTIVNCRFIDNNAYAAVQIQTSRTANCNITVERCQFLRGGYIFTPVYLFGSMGTLAVTNTVFSSNYCTFRGCGVFAGTQGDVYISNSTFYNNSAGALDGGAVSVLTGTSATIEDSLFDSNHALTGTGGGIAVSVPTVLQRCRFVNNTSFSLGSALALQSTGAPLALRAINCTFECNHWSSKLGAEQIRPPISYENGTVVDLVDCVLVTDVCPVTCNEGSTTNNIFFACTACTAGRYFNLTDINATSLSSSHEGVVDRFGYCLACPMGRYSAQPAMTGCLQCSAGRYSNITEAVECQACARGSYQPGSGASECPVCRAGYKLNSYDLPTLCTPCEAGYYSAKDGSDKCARCTGFLYTSPAAQRIGCTAVSGPALFVLASGAGFALLVLLVCCGARCIQWKKQREAEHDWASHVYTTEFGTLERDDEVEAPVEADQKYCILS